MIKFGNFLHDETKVVGLSSLGLSRKEIRNVQPQNQAQSPKQLQQGMTLFAANQLQNKNNFQVNFVEQSAEKSLESLFGRGTTLKFNNSKTTG